jgi:hypothetical protein
LSIFNEAIFDSNVDRLIPSFAAAPDGPNTRPPLSRKATSIISFSWAASLWDSFNRLFGSLASAGRSGGLDLCDLQNVTIHSALRTNHKKIILNS